MNTSHFVGLSIQAVLNQSPLNPLETRLLLSHVLELSRVQLITQSEQSLSAEQAQHLFSLFQRRLAGEPIAYLVGTREFYGLSFQVTPAVLIPRPETELLVELACAHLPIGGRVLDLGTGSGAIAVAIAHMRPDAYVTAVDNSQAALEVARVNAMRHGAQASFLLSNWYGSLHDEYFDIIVANPPYIAMDDEHLKQGDLRYEPTDALTDHSDGLSALRIIIAGAAHCLVPGGGLLVEHGYDQAATVRKLMQAQQLKQVQSWRDLADIERVSGASR